MFDGMSKPTFVVVTLIGGLALFVAGFIIATEMRSADASPPAAGTANYIGKFINATELDNSALYESGGKIGLGTTGPDGKLDVRASNLFLGSGDSTYVYGTATIREDAPDDSVLAMHSEDGGVTYVGFDFSADRGVIATDCGSAAGQLAGCSPGQDLAFITDAGTLNGGDNFGDAVPKMIIRRDGNVGIGTETPQSKLHVASGYIQFPTRSGSVPPAADCDSSDEAGRMVIRTDSATNLYVCKGTGGWAGMSSGAVVGGIGELPPMAGIGGSPSHNYAVAATLALVAFVAFGAGGWYAKRRWGR